LHITDDVLNQSPRIRHPPVHFLSAQVTGKPEAFPDCGLAPWTCGQEMADYKMRLIFYLLE
jgi:hypothetical protein